MDSIDFHISNTKVIKGHSFLIQHHWSWVDVRFVVTPKPADVGEHLKPNTRPYHQVWWLFHIFNIPRGAAIIPWGGCTDTPTPCLQRSSGELNLRPMIWYHVRFVVTPKPTNVDEHLKPRTRPYHQEWRLVHLFYIPRGVAVIPWEGCTDTPTPPLQHSLRELNLIPMIWYHVRFVVTPKLAEVDENLKPRTRPYHQEFPKVWWLYHVVVSIIQ